MSVTKLQQTLDYLGRTAQRTDSRDRRAAILSATLRVIEKEGVRGVRHRAVAKEADVPLAATTYYFEDIDTLLHDTFIYYVMKDMGGARALERAGLELVSLMSVDGSIDGDELANIRQKIVKSAVLLLKGHLLKKVERVDKRKIEIAFRAEALRNPVLAKPFKLLHQAQLEAIQACLAEMGSLSPREDADLVLSALLYWDYHAQLYGGRDEEWWAQVEASLQHLMSGLF